jgi:hypothetical protein
MLWNFVGSDRGSVDRAAADWTAAIAGGFRGARFVLPPDEHEHVPLPGVPVSGPPANDHDCPTS